MDDFERELADVLREATEKIDAMTPERLRDYAIASMCFQLSHKRLVELREQSLAVQFAGKL